MSTAVVLFVLVAAGIVLMWLVRRMLGTLGEASALALLAAPLVIYGIAHGSIAEFTGFGVTTKFSKRRRTKVTDLAGKLAIRSRLDEMDFAKAATFAGLQQLFHHSR